MWISVIKAALLFFCAKRCWCKCLKVALVVNVWPGRNPNFSTIDHRRQCELWIPSQGRSRFLPPANRSLRTTFSMRASRVARINLAWKDTPCTRTNEEAHPYHNLPLVTLVVTWHVVNKDCFKHPVVWVNSNFELLLLVHVLNGSDSALRPLLRLPTPLPVVSCTAAEQVKQFPQFSNLDAANIAIQNEKLPIVAISANPATTSSIQRYKAWIWSILCQKSDNKDHALNPELVAK